MHALGHWHEECGTGEHDVAKLGWGPFLIAASLELAAIVSVGAISSLGGRAID